MFGFDVAQAKIDVDKWTKVLDRLTDEKLKGFQDNLTEKIQEYKILKIEADNSAKQYRDSLKEIINPDLLRIEKLIKEIEAKIEAQNEKKNKILVAYGNADSKASAERLMDAFEATESFASVSLQQTIAQNTFQEGHEDDYKLLYNLVNDLFEEGLLLKQQTVLIGAIENITKESELLRFMADSDSLLSYPVLEKDELQRINQKMLPMRSEKDELQRIKQKMLPKRSEL